MRDRNEINISPKSYGVSVMLSMIFGIVGIHHFYMGNWLHGLLDFSLFVMAFYCLFINSDPGIVGIGCILIIIDIIHTIMVTYRLFVGRCRDGNGLLIVYPGQNDRAGMK